LLDFVAEGDGALDALAYPFGMRVVEKPFKDGEGFVVGERNDQICGEIVGINVEHEIGKNPEIESFLKATAVAWRIETLCSLFWFHRADRRELL